MSDDVPYTKREMDFHFDNLNKRFDKQDKVLESICAQTTATNGRVNKVEAMLEDYPQIKKDVLSLNNNKWYAIGAIAVIILMGYFALKSIIKDQIDIAFDNRFTKIEIK